MAMACLICCDVSVDGSKPFIGGMAGLKMRDGCRPGFEDAAFDGIVQCGLEQRGRRLVCCGRWNRCIVVIGELPENTRMLSLFLGGAKAAISEGGRRAPIRELSGQFDKSVD